MRPTVLFGLLLVSISRLQALEIHFRSSFVELVSDGVSQRVRPGELVEVPTGESMMEMEVSDRSPRTVELRARGRCEFEVFGTPSVLEDAGKMTISMDPDTKKLDIAWLKGEMKAAPSSFDKSAAAAFFVASAEEFMRPLDFSGIRPFGYTDILEGRGSMVAEGDWRNLPPLPESPIQPDGGRPRPSYNDLEPPPDWRTFEEEQSDLPPLALPPPATSRRPIAPTQVLVLSPADPTKTEPALDDEGLTKKSQDDIDAESTVPPLPEKTSDVELTDSVDVNSGDSPNPPVKVPTSTSSEESLSTQPSPAPSLSPSPSPSLSPFSPPRPASRSSASASPAQGSRPTQSGPTLYDRIVAQEEKQQEVIELLLEVSKQVQDIKSPPASITAPLSQKGESPTPSPAPPPPPPATNASLPSVKPTPNLMPPVPRESSSPKSVQPIGSRANPAPSLPRSLETTETTETTETKAPKATPTPARPKRTQSASDLGVSPPTTSATSATSASTKPPSPSTADGWDFSLEAVGTPK